MVLSLLLQGLADLFQLGARGAPIASPPFDPLVVELSGSKLARVLDGKSYTSSDFGFTWNEISEIQDAEELKLPMHAREDDFIVIDSHHDTAYITFDAGLTFTKIHAPEELNGIVSKEFPDGSIDVLFDDVTYYSVNHDHPEWLIANNYDIRVPWSVAVTRDAGKTWQYHDKETWESCEFVEDGQFVKNLIHCQRGSITKESLISPIFDIKYDTYYSTDMTESFMLVEGIPYRSSVQRHGDILTTADDDSHEPTISYDGIHFNKVKFPANMSPSDTNSKIYVHGTTYFDSRGSLLVFVPYISEEEPGWRNVGAFGNVFTLESPFELKLLAENVASIYRDQARIMPIQSEDGVFIATIVANPDSVKFSNEAPLYKTVITFDGGDNWNPLTGPNGKQLHLFIDDLEDSTYWHSKSCVPGFLSAYGNEGDYLTTFPRYNTSTSLKELHSYLSRDSGRTWTKVNDNPVDYEIGDYGNILVEQPRWYNGAKDYLEYTTDGGYTWHKYQLGFNARVTHITAERSGAGKNFLINFELPNESYDECSAFTLSFEQEQNQDQDQILFLN